MKNLTPTEFRSRKKHRALAIMGSGWSINESTRMWRIHQQFDTIGFNWYCKSERPTTFYLIREQCVSPKRCERGNEINDLVRLVNSAKPVLIVKDKAVKNDTYSHVENLGAFKCNGIVVNDLTTKGSAWKFKKTDMFKQGLIHGKNTLYDTMHFAVQMGYKKILFCGIDLYDSRYFWLKKDETRELLERGNRSCDQTHKQVSNVISLVRVFKEAVPEIELMVENPKSLLAKHMKVWK